MLTLIKQGQHMDKEPLVDMIWAILPAGGSVVNESKKPQKSQGLILSGESVQTHFFSPCHVASPFPP